MEKGLNENKPVKFHKKKARAAAARAEEARIKEEGVAKATNNRISFINNGSSVVNNGSLVAVKKKRKQKKKRIVTANSKEVSNNINIRQNILNQIASKRAQIEQIETNLEESKENNILVGQLFQSRIAVLSTEINELLQQLSTIPNVSGLNVYKTNYNQNINRINVPFISNETQRNFLRLNPEILDAYRALDARPYNSSLTLQEKNMYRTLFIQILNHIISKLIYDPLKVVDANGKSNHFLDYMNRLIEEEIFSNKSIEFKRYIKLLIYNGFFKNVEKSVENITLKISLQLDQKMDQFTNHMENYLIKTNSALTLDNNDSYIYPIQYFTDYFKDPHYIGDYLYVPYSDVFNFKGKTTQTEVYAGRGASSSTNIESQSKTYIDTFEYIIENYFYNPIHRIGNNILTLHFLHNFTLGKPLTRMGKKDDNPPLNKLFNKIKNHAFNQTNPLEKISDTNTLNYINQGKIPFRINDYIINIPFPFCVKSVDEDYGGDYSGLTKTFFDNINSEINNAHIIDGQYIHMNKNVSIVKNNKIPQTIRNQEISNEKRTFIPKNSINVPNKNKVHKKILFVSLIKDFFTKKILKTNNPNNSKYKFTERKTRFIHGRVPHPTNSSKTIPSLVESVANVNVLQFRDSNYIPLVNNMISYADDRSRVVKNTFNIQILLFTIITIFICALSRETRIKTRIPTDIRHMNVKILFGKCKDGNISLSYKIFLAYYILSLREEYSNPNKPKILTKAQFDEYIFYLTLFYENKELYNYIVTKDESNLRLSYTLYRKNITENEAYETNIDTIINYFKNHYVNNNFIDKYTSEIGLTNFNRLLDFFGYDNIEVFMKEHFEGEIINKESIIKNKIISITPYNQYHRYNITQTVSSDFFRKIMNKFINSLNNEQLYIYSKFISGTLLIQSQYKYTLSSISHYGANVAQFRSHTCANDHTTLLAPLINDEKRHEITQFDNSLTSTTFIDNDIDNSRTVVSYNPFEKALYKLYILNKDQTVEIMQQAISSFGFT
jgi:hypothetical protein